MSDHVQQGTPEWLQARLGKVTASRVADVVAKTKTGVSASRASYMSQLLVERLTGVVEDSFTSAAMAWGTETEPLARATYEAHTGVLVDEVGFIQHPSIEGAGASPDGLVGTDGLIEIKCPNTSTHISTLLGAKVPSKYVNQMQWQMACTGRRWCDFVTFDPRMPDRLQMLVVRVQRDDKAIAELEGEVKKFLDELEATIEKLEKLGEVK